MKKGRFEKCEICGEAKLVKQNLCLNHKCKSRK